MSVAQMSPTLASVSQLRASALARFRGVRAASLAMCAPLSTEEYRLQPIEEVSPPWWNLGHTSWFFVRNVLAPFGGRLEPVDDEYDYLLNSYYESLGSRLPQGKRGAISRPTTDEIYEYRRSVDRRVAEVVEAIDGDRLANLLSVLEIGVQHEQQHQELFYTEIKFIRFQNPRALRKPYALKTLGATAGSPGIVPLSLRGREAGSDGDIGTPQRAFPTSTIPLRFHNFDSGLFDFGNLEGAWCWDNELPIHQFFLQPFALADRLITNGEFLAFIDDGGYRNPLLWLDNGWQQATAAGWHAPLYWEFEDGGWWTWTLGGMQPLALNEPASHLSFYEADAFARWWAANHREDGGVRLPTEREWEHAARTRGPATRGTAFQQLDCCLWQWTGSYYEPYPGYQPFPGALAEYNGKFMDNQRVLRGGSYVTPRDHYRLSYRNFWPAATRFQFTGLRLARTSR